MAVLDPLKVTIENYEELSLSCNLSVPDFPQEPDSGERHVIAADRVVFIDRSDYHQVKFF